MRLCNGHNCQKSLFVFFPVQEAVVTALLQSACLLFCINVEQQLLSGAQ